MCPAIKLRLNDDAAKYIIDKTLTDRSYGARPLRRALQKYIEDPPSEALIQGTLPRPSELEVYLGESGIYVRQLQEEPVGVSESGVSEGGVAEGGGDTSPIPIRRASRFSFLEDFV